MHGVGGNHLVLKIDVLEELVRAGDLVAVGEEVLLAHHHATIAEQRREQVDPAAATFAGRAAQGLAVDGQSTTGDLGLEPGSHGGIEQVSVEGAKGPSDGGLAGNYVAPALGMSFAAQSAAQLAAEVLKPTLRSRQSCAGLKSTAATQIASRLILRVTHSPSMAGIGDLGQGRDQPPRTLDGDAVQVDHSPTSSDQLGDQKVLTKPAAGPWTKLFDQNPLGLAVGDVIPALLAMLAAKALCLTQLLPARRPITAALMARDINEGLQEHDGVAMGHL